MITPKVIPYRGKAQQLINEGDILLFRGTSWISRWIKRFTQGRYSHVALASWHETNAHLECVEFREGAGGRTVSFETQLEKYDKKIDVYRVLSPKKLIHFDEERQVVLEEWVEYPAHSVTSDLRKMTGLPYGYTRIIWLLKFHLLGLRLLYKDPALYDDTPIENDVYPVCSTAVSTCTSRHQFDLVRNRSDQRTTPSDCARSSACEYLFTPEKDW